MGSIPRSGRSSEGGKQQPTPVFLPENIPWTEEPGGLQSMGSQRVRNDRVTEHSHTHLYQQYVRDACSPSPTAGFSFFIISNLLVKIGVS